MSDMSQYRDMLRELRKKRGTLSESPPKPLKRRKKSSRNRDRSSIPPPSSDSDSSSNKKKTITDFSKTVPVIEGTHNASDSDVKEVKPLVFLNNKDQLDLRFEEVEQPPKVEEIDLTVSDTHQSHASSDDEFGSDEFENVEFEEPLESSDLLITSNLPSSDLITVPIQQPVPRKKTKKNVNSISREEKSFRKSFHYSVLATMACHGVLRNHWINDKSLQDSLRKSVPRDLVKILNEYLICDADIERSYTEKQIQSRKLLDCLKKLMEFWNHNFVINKDVGIYKKLWNEIDGGDIEKMKPISLLRFKNRVIKKRGSRDIAAQGFVSLLRSLGLLTRLVFSLQPPDFTNNSKVELGSRSASPLYKPRPPQTPVKSVKGLRPGEKLLQQFRNKKAVNEEFQLGSQSIDNESEYPVFWAEVWDKFSKKWISIDTICFKYIEVVRVISKFEPPSTDQRNNAYYVWGYDNYGRVRDITRRYAKNYNAKTRKKRITREPKGELWYDRLITSLCSETGKLETGIDIKELEYFQRKSLQEGMPNSIQDFKNHPVYVLEDQLKSNEIISPKTPCGRTRKKNSKNTETIPVYKRENVHTVRSAKAWYMRGRVLKTGERPMLIKSNDDSNNIRNKKNANFRYEDDLFGDDDLDNANDNDDNDKRLYAESQTELYIPPPVVDGEVPKNAFGNIDLYVPSMLPANACYRDSKLAIKAAKSLGIDYAEAVVGFDFTRGGATTARTKGIVIASEYEDAMISLEQHLQLEEEERLRKRTDLNALRGWRLLLTKLRIRDDLNRKYGNVDGIDEVVEEQFRKVEAQFSKASKSTYDSEDDDDLYGKYYDSTSSNEDEENNEDANMGGGFLPEDKVDERSISPTPEKSDYSDNDRSMVNNGGYVLDDYQGDTYRMDDYREDVDAYAGGFIPGDIASDDEDATAGGFINEKKEELTSKNESASPVSSKTLAGDTHEIELKQPMVIKVLGKRGKNVMADDYDEEDFIYDPNLQNALLQESKMINNLSSEDEKGIGIKEFNDDDLSDLYTTSRSSDQRIITKDETRTTDSHDGDDDDDYASVDSLELANEGVQDDEEEELNDDEEYDDNEFEYSDDD